jgi:threonine aldolase
MVLHMDGARLCNAAASLHIGLNDLVGKAGVDILSFGGTKNGMMYGEAIVVLDARKAAALPFYRKQGMQLASKMRYISAQFQAMLGTDLWQRNASHANAMASLLAQSLKEIADVAITQKVETNMVFATLPEACLKALQDRYFFHRFDERTTEVRLVCSFQTTPQEVHAFAADVRRVLQQR